MKKLSIAILPLAFAGCAINGPAPASAPIRVVQGETLRVEGPRHVYTTSPGTPLNRLYTPEQAQKIVTNFRQAYDAMGKPRIDIRVNTPFGTLAPSPLPVPGVQFGPAIDPATGLPVVGATPIPGAPNPVPAAGAAIPPAPTQVFDASALTERQTQREVETLFGRPLRSAGAQLVDADLANLPELTFEVLISERELVLQGIRKTETVTVPDIQVTALRLADARIVGQASVLDLFPRKEQAAYMLRRYDIRQLTEATALALMQDIAATAEP
ncbi:MAG: hypothetical protein CMO74_08260 [Verrucomicrobiales bacterium]|nr:hypothetical protein [Verrucomicrobiales bacterium]|tara:strand:+ start:278 stop:1087 length:810 start_codon:yes stop_codon:yes gene_type:complete